MPRKVLAFLFLALSELLASKAFADVPPPDACTAVGQSCSNAPPDYHTAGTCKASTCNRTLPAPDGGLRTTSYDCMLCAAQAGTGGAGPVTTPPSGSSDSGCNCVVSPAHAGGTMALGMLVAGILALLSERRSRRG